LRFYKMTKKAMKERIVTPQLNTRAYKYAALLLHKVGMKVDEYGIKAVLTAAGATTEEPYLKAFLLAFENARHEAEEKIICDLKIKDEEPSGMAGLGALFG